MSMLLAKRIRTAAREFIDNDVSVIPGRPESKAPALKKGELKNYRSRLATESELSNWFRSPRKIIALCGSPSDYLEVLDFDHDVEDVWPRWYEEVSDIVNWLPVVETPSGGFHVWYRCFEISPSQRLAVNDQGAVRIETKGEKGLITCPGSFCEYPNLPYVQVQGPPIPFDIPVLSVKERMRLFDAAQLFDEGQLFAKALEKQKRARAGRNRRKSYAFDSPWKKFNENTDPVELLVSLGWKTSDGTHFTRPGKTKGTSATLRRTKRGRFCVVVFSSSIPELPAGKHSLFDIYAAYCHGGNKSEAIKRLVKEGYGGPNA